MMWLVPLLIVILLLYVLFLTHTCNETWEGQFCKSGILILDGKAFLCFLFCVLYI